MQTPKERKLPTSMKNRNNLSQLKHSNITKTIIPYKNIDTKNREKKLITWLSETEMALIKPEMSANKDTLSVNSNLKALY